MTAGRIPNIEGGIQPTLLSTTGDIMYASSASNPARLGIGSSAQVLTVSGGVPSWATPSASGMTLISTTTMNTTDISIGSLTGYKDLKIVLRNPYLTSGYSSLRFNADSASNYRPSQQRADNATTMQSLASAVTTGINLSPSSGPLTSTNYSTAVIYIHDYNNTASYKLFQINSYWAGWGGANASASIEWNVYQSLSAITSINLMGVWAGGSCLLYGVN